MAGRPVEVDVHFVADGPPEAPVVVLSNSLGSTVEMWEPQVPVLSERFRVVRYDHRGHGGSPVPPGPYALEELGRDVVRLLDRLGLERASFCGLSLGGMVGMWLAAHAAERVDRLVLCCTSALLGPPEMWAQRAATVREHGTAAVAETVVSRWFTPEFAAREPATVARMRDMVAATPPEGYAGCCAAVQEMDLRADLAAIAAPTLVIAGRDDPATPPEHGRQIAEGIRGARLAVVPDAAHLGSFEQAGKVTPLVLEHLDGLPNRREAR
jgi:3-oxoadipate enol-lactonase